MNKRQKEVERAKLESEKCELNILKDIYSKAAEDISRKLKISNSKIDVLLEDIDNLDDKQKSILQSQIYQRDFQTALKRQIDSFLSALNNEQYNSINAYLEDCYEVGYVGSMYDIHGQGIPLIIPINQKNVVKAIQINSKISKRLYTKLGEDVERLKKRIASNISRGIATSSAYSVIARNIVADSNVGFNNAMRISRTEGHRVQANSAFDAQVAAKKSGADILKQWNAALDGRTRKNHRKLDGQIRELEEPFETGGMKAMYPSDFGKPAEDINCRCAIVQRARWELDDDELERLKKRAEYYGLDKTGSFNDFRKKYMKAVGKLTNSANDGIIVTPKKSKDDKYNDILYLLQYSDVKYRAVKNQARFLNSSEIISELSGGDLTGGSCASVGLAYIGQKLGWNILDFRGGESGKIFSSSMNLLKLSEMNGIKALKASGKSSMTVANRLLKQCEVGKEYYLAVGRHCAIVRKTEKGTYQYLELQSKDRSGWTDFNGNPKYTLKTRFGCTNTSGMAAYTDFMIDIDESDFSSSDDFKTLLGFINTSVDEQRKGQHGTIK